MQFSIENQENALAIAIDLALEVSGQPIKILPPILHSAVSLIASYVYSSYSVRNDKGEEIDINDIVVVAEDWSFDELLFNIAYSLIVFNRAYIEIIGNVIRYLNPLGVDTEKKEYFKEQIKGKLIEIKVPNGLPTIANSLPQLLNREISLLRLTKKVLEDYFRNATVPTGILSVKMPSIQGLKEIEREIRNKTLRGGGSFGILILKDTEVQFTPLSKIPDPSGFVELGKSLAKEILAVLRVPPALLSLDEEKSNLVIEQKKVFFQTVIRPLLRKIELFINKKLFPTLGIKANFKYTAIFISDEQLAVERAKLGGMLGVLTINELRQLLGFPPISEGEDLVPNWNAPSQKETELSKALNEYLSKLASKQYSD